MFDESLSDLVERTVELLLLTLVFPTIPLVSACRFSDRIFAGVHKRQHQHSR